MAIYSAPGVYWQHVSPPGEVELRTGVPAFLGYAERSASSQPNVYQKLTNWSQFPAYFGEHPFESFLAPAVRAFFENGGRLCYVGRLSDSMPPVLALRTFLDSATAVDEVDILCAPDTMRTESGKGVSLEEVRQMQTEVLEYCERKGDCFAILDTIPSGDVEKVLAQRQGLGGWSNGALYYPWIKTPREGVVTATIVPPCGHVAGIFARSDEYYGVHKAPANERLEHAVDLSLDVTTADQERLNPIGINCLRNFPGRGIRVWGARTLSGQPAWAYINVRRLFITAARWMERHLCDMAFEPNTIDLWGRIERQLLVYFGGLFRQGALKGRTEQEAFYIKCDAETNTHTDRAAGRVVGEIGLAPLVPNEFVIVRLIKTPSGMTLAGPIRPS